MILAYFVMVNHFLRHNFNLEVKLNQKNKFIDKIFRKKKKLITNSIRGIFDKFSFLFFK